MLAAAKLPGELHTLLHPTLSNSAARAFFAGGYGQLPVTATREPAEVGMRNSLLRRYAAAHGGELTEIERVRVVEETCRTASSQCASLMARWIVETPQSPVRDRMRGKLAQNQAIVRSTRLNMVDRLRWLYDGAPRPPREGDAAPRPRRRPSSTSSSTTTPRRSRAQALARLWQRCEQDPKQQQACFSTRMNLKRKLGDLGE